MYETLMSLAIAVSSALITIPLLGFVLWGLIRITH